MGMTLIDATPLPLPLPTQPLQMNVCAISSAPHCLLQKITMFYDIPLGSPDVIDSDWDCVDPQYDTPRTPEQSQQSSYNAPVHAIDSDEDDEVQAQLVPRRKPGGYDSRIEQILYENPELPVLITDAGKSLENGGRHIVYTIRTGVCGDAYNVARP